MSIESQSGSELSNEALAELVKQSIPKHVAIIMDGNGRWAQAQGKPRVVGHKAGVKTVRRAVSMAREMGIGSLTLFAFSSENWRRPEKEVSLLMELFFTVLQREIKLLDKNGVRLNIIGDISRFSARLQKQIAAAMEKTANNDGLILNVAANYGGRWDIVQAAQTLAKKVESGEMTSSQFTEEALSQHLSMQNQPEVDLMIRTGGDFRISNFVLWQAAYAELVFTDVLWPDFDEQAFKDAVAVFATRQRRFGLTGSQIETLQAE
ncbi:MULTISPECIES: polyprenyl diphosphate synthase [Shewanella]|uniref:polyprenyl diphosphate synthase n=1 Tax=Shewanella TaxID=22 RepID=UPI001183895F|nr:MULTISPECIES: polyprenyl diphosphate synthase [Shewanella]QYJ81316.1 di-trans,poly-cis-decaprenylcistransferase [Shewanella aegiceratis]QYJ91223.1 di-trans,poly-cis-decaprenylcistransferase [Shewanella halotolerans]QYJ96554.1 di-trans,poly-cis-decaprenylcistransferase [Shewanella alkalitolerans]TVP15127.1 di-trans,poly-cis-decaprenylcistransferase [Shewanella sp. KCT]